MAKWAELPYDLIARIAKRVKVMEDFIAFGNVCKSWGIAATKENFDVFSPQVPLLMLADKNEQKVSRMFLPEARGPECFPSQGWIFTNNNNTGDMNLLHPFSRTQIQLPSQKNILASQGRGEVIIWSCMDKAILSVSPSLTSDYVLFVSYYGCSHCLSYWRPGDLNWTNIIGQWSGEVWVFDVAGPEPIEPRLLVQLGDDTWQLHRSRHFYLVHYYWLL